MASTYGSLEVDRLDKLQIASLYHTILTYHKLHKGNKPGDVDSSRALLDLGCGHGLVSRALAPHFTTVTAVDPSPGMVAQARQLTTAPNITIHEASAEDLSFLPCSSVDLAVAGEAAHWFDYTRAWAELARVVCQGGSLAFWGYNDSLVEGYPQLRAILQRYCYGMEEVRPGMEALGRFWEEPGRTVLRDFFVTIEPPQEEWQDVRRVIFKPDDSPTYGVEKAPEEALWLRKRMKLGEYEVYLRTMSSVQNWRAAHPEMRSEAEGGEGDILDALVEAFLEAVPEWKAKGEGWREVEVDIVWGTCLLMARRK
ncbi:trans-aconitate methyltransferase 1 [Gnomoniopsis smithogilvyi]|uniref:Trans-aconitate methyltransferase 1 n=1 Tax=Gnomoniopsis smithogilvyi TaxID=1191159 RepID=A0A9W8YIM4_9PEZI|nr:trans-aconitate methyltransferase 1 [Gnomoniopsis smithogilvyi]